MVVVGRGFISVGVGGGLRGGGGGLLFGRKGRTKCESRVSEREMERGKRRLDEECVGGWNEGEAT